MSKPIRGSQRRTGNNLNAAHQLKKKTGNCSICYEQIELVNISKKCKHEPNACLNCVTNSVRTEIQGKGQSRIECSAGGCNVAYEPEEFYPLLDQRLKDIVDKLLLNKLLETEEEFRWCKSKKGCGAGQLVSNYRELRGYYTCHSCGTMLCYRHDMEWHQGFNCEEYETEKARNPDFASEGAISAFTKKCPNENCQTAIMKHEGCDVISCCRFGTHDCNDKKGKCDHGGRPYCGQKFCWKCLGKIDINHSTGAYQRHCKPTCDYFNLN